RGDAQLTRDGAIIGSPLYMSPEQGRGQIADHRSDIYSLGCTLYHMLCGRPPFSGPSPVGIMSMHVTDRATPVRDRSPQVPLVVARVVERMLAKDPDDRPRDYDEVIGALEGARAPRRELGGMGARGIALAIDAVLLLVAAYFLRLLVLPVAFVYWVLCHRWLGQTPGKWLLGIRVESAFGGKLSWKAALLRTAAFAWGPLAWTVLAVIVYVFHGEQQVSFQLSKLRLSELAIPIVYLVLATGILVGYVAGFLLVAFHPKRQALHDILAKTLVYIKSRAPAGDVVDAVMSGTGIGISRYR
ncbi:MAG: RDD family protein, partial [Deltaproteobacteria bacterium]|nr:RDD family protein [Deltaproteobacteria bacterium]